MHTDWELIRRIRYFAFDSDGVLFPNTVWEGAGIKPKVRSYYDGQGISLLRALGIRVCVITNERGASAAGVRATVKKWNELPSSMRGDWPPIQLFEGCGGQKKLVTLTKWLRAHGGAPERCGAMGDDLIDAAMLQAVAFRAAPISGEEVIRRMCHFVSKRPGGEGAVRDLANLFVEAHGKDLLELSYE